MILVWLKFFIFAILPFYEKDIDSEFGCAQKGLSKFKKIVLHAADFSH